MKLETGGLDFDNNNNYCYTKKSLILFILKAPRKSKSSHQFHSFWLFFYVYEWRLY